jgi:ubiquinone/menaquinone biosynthesis C-methylase UbiE
MKFHTNFVYTDRQTKAHYVYLKYQPILVGNILDVGADQCYLKEHLGNKVNYIGIGLSSDKLDLKIDLEKQSLPYKDNSFDVVLCCDVLEHLDNIHEIFDKLCMVSKEYVIISLPNPHSVFLSYLKHGDYNEHQHLKFYGLPAEKPGDRHKWFFSTDEAENFIRYRANKNNMEIIQIDIEGNGPNKINFFKKIFLKISLRKYFNLYFDLISNKNLYSSTLWAVLKKEGLK